MKKSALALAVLAALFLNNPANAWSRVRVHGLIDAGIEAVNHSGANDGGMVRVISGGKNTSRWGLRGSEELGDGLRAVFNLEGGILLDTGATDDPLGYASRYSWATTGSATGPSKTAASMRWAAPGFPRAWA